jgi:homoserine kinase
VANLGNLAAFVSALHSGDLALLGRSIHDAMVEPVRAPLIPGFASAKQAALSSGAMGCSISGSGPSLFAVCDSRLTAQRAANAMRAAFLEAVNLDSDVYVQQVNRRGASVSWNEPDAVSKHKGTIA